MPIIQLIRTSRIYRRSSFASSARLALSFNRDFPRVVLRFRIRISQKANAAGILRGEQLKV